MFDLGTQELIVIFIVAFLVFGPKKLPELGRTLGKGMRELKEAMRGVKDTIEEASSDVTDEIKGAKSDLEESIYKTIAPNIEEQEETDKSSEEGENKTVNDVNNSAEEEDKEQRETDKDG